jgi:hypothetical protein
MRSPNRLRMNVGGGAAGGNVNVATAGVAATCGSCGGGGNGGGGLGGSGGTAGGSGGGSGKSTARSKLAPAAASVDADALVGSSLQ